ncbi:MAG TPA: M14 family zinc carboxypeptidase [Gaiellaceae bacterium]
MHRTGAGLLLVALVAALAAGARALPSAGKGESIVSGRSVEGRAIQAIDVGSDRDRGPNVLVVGCIHGNEPAGIAISRALIAAPPPHSVDLWVVPDLNPDGVAADTRQNAHRVDLNRNFPWHWRVLGTPGFQQYSGPHVLSEPESRFAYRLILRLRPTITIWFHQPLDLVDESGGNPRLERRFAQLAGLPFHRLPRYPGSAASWQNHTIAGSSAFVVELPPGPLAPGAARRLAEAVLDLSGESATT